MVKNRHFPVGMQGERGRGGIMKDVLRGMKEGVKLNAEGEQWEPRSYFSTEVWAARIFSTIGFNKGSCFSIRSSFTFARARLA